MKNTKKIKTISLKEFLQNLEINFKKLDWYERAFIHRSFLNEAKQGGLKPNERLEFLGDAVLELIVSQFLFEQYPDKKEGDLTFMRSKIVQTATLAKAAKRLKLDQQLKLSKGERLAHGEKNPAILADTFEAFLGAIYKDQGLPACVAFIKKRLLNKVKSLLKDTEIIDYKSLFQEKIQAAQKGTPTYRIIKSWGPDHSKQFKIAALISSQEVSRGAGKSKQQAEQRAAQKALEKIKEIL